MKANIVDLRYRMKDVLKALERNEDVMVLYHGKVKGIIKPVSKQESENMRDHAFFGMEKKPKKSVSKVMNDLRKNRYDDL